jgi:hypothetical protein
MFATGVRTEMSFFPGAPSHAPLAAPRADRFRPQRDPVQYTVAWGVLRTLIAPYPGIAADHLATAAVEELDAAETFSRKVPSNA